MARVLVVAVAVNVVGVVRVRVVAVAVIVVGMVLVAVVVQVSHKCGHAIRSAASKSEFLLPVQNGFKFGEHHGASVELLHEGVVAPETVSLPLMVHLEVWLKIEE